MRDLLTAIAGLAIAVLVALLAVPPLIDWPAHRAFVDQAIGRAIGGVARTEGVLDLRVLPTPRIRIGRLRIGSEDPDGVVLDAQSVKGEIALAPLLGGEVRFLDTRIGRAEIKLPTGAGGDWRVPPSLVDAALQRRKWVFDDLAVAQFLLTTVEPETGRTDQAYAEGVRIQAGSLAGPWRFTGTSGSVPIELAIGELGDDRSAAVKIGGGGGQVPRFDGEGRLTLVAGTTGALVPRLAGTARMQVPLPPIVPNGPVLPLSARAAFVASGRAIGFTDVTVEAGEGARAFRATGSGELRIDAPRLALALAGRRLDLSGGRRIGPDALRSALTRWSPPGGLPVQVSLSLDGLGIGADEDLSQVRVSVAIDEEGVHLGALEASGPGRASLTMSGEASLGQAFAANGRVAVAAADSERFGRFLASLGLEDAPAILTGPPLDASGDFAASETVVSLRNVRAALGPTTLVGTVRATAADGATRGRFDAQLGLQNLDVLDLVPAGDSLVGAARGIDFGLTIDAREVSYGVSRGGRISGRVASEGPAILVEGLEIRGLAGADADGSGRIAPDGTGRIEGHLTAAKAAPLVDLIGPLWIGSLARLVPSPVREGPLDLRLTAERVADPGSPEPLFRTALTGRAGGGPFQATTLTAAGALRELSVQISTEDGGRWLPLAIGQRRPAKIAASGRRAAPDAPLLVDVSGEVAGVRLATPHPLRLGEGDRLEGGEAELVSDDASGLFRGAGLPVSAPLPLRLAATLARSDRLGAKLSGTIGSASGTADLAWSEAGGVTGSASVARASLPFLASWLALASPAETGAASPAWPTTRFGPRRSGALEATLAVEAASLDFGQGWVGRDATFRVSTRPDGFKVEDLRAAVGTGRVQGSFAIDRQGGQASLIGEGSTDGLALERLFGPPFAAGRLHANLRFGASGESPAGLVAALGGAGEVAIEGLRIEAADPGAPSRVAARALKSDDPLASGRWQGAMPEELGRAPLAADRVAAAGSLVGGALRLGPLVAEGEGGAWRGSATLDLKTLSVDVRGTLQSRAGPPGWTGPPPTLGLGWAGPFARPSRTVDPGPLVNGLAAAVLARELDRIDTLDQDFAERQRRAARTEFERQRRLDAEAARLERETPPTPPSRPPSAASNGG